MSSTYVRKNFVKGHVKKNYNVLDVGSGLSTILEGLPEINYYGFDIDIDNIKYAKKKFTDKKFHFYCRKFTIKEITKLPGIDCALLLGIIHHLNDKEFIELIYLIKKILKKNGKVLILDNVITKNQNLISNFLIKSDRGNNIRNLNQYKLILNKFFPKIKYKISHQKFIPYTWLKIVCYK